VHALGARDVSLAVPTTKCNAWPFAAKGTRAIEKAASLLSRSSLNTLLSSASNAA